MYERNVTSVSYRIWICKGWRQGLSCNMAAAERAMGERVGHRCGEHEDRRESSMEIDRETSVCMED